MEFLIHLSKSVGILTLFYLVYLVILRKETYFTANRHYLFAGIISAILFPFIEFTNTIYVTAPAQLFSTGSETLVNTTPIEQVVVSNIDWWQIGVIIYLIGVTFFLLRFLKQLYSLLLLLKTCPSEKKGGYTYLKFNENSSPFSFFTYIVYNPILHSQEELEMILKHEQVHVTQRHSIDIIASNLILIFQWGNPLAWFYKKSIEENLEFIADNATAQEVNSIKQYQLALLRASSAHPISQLSSNFYQSFIKKRIIMLNKSTSKKINVWKVSIILPFLALFLWSFNVKESIVYEEVNPNYLDASETSIITIDSGIEQFISDKQRGLSPIVNSEVTQGTPLIIPKQNIEKENKPNSENRKTSNKLNFGNPEVIVTITKDTSKEEIEKIKKNLESQGYTFDFKNLVYNDSKEIISISLSYKDAKNNSGNYSVSSDKAINTIRINANENGVSVNSFGRGDYSFSRGENRQIRSIHPDRKAEMRDQKEEMEHRNQEMKARHKEMEIRREDMHEARRANMGAMRELREEIHEENHEILEEQLRGSPEHRKMLHDKKKNRSFTRARYNGDEKATTIIMPSTKKSSELIVIDKNTSKEELDGIKKSLSNQNITFNYKKLTRNDAGEITSIKIEIENDKGSKTSTIVDGDGIAIDNIIVKI